MTKNQSVFDVDVDVSGQVGTKYIPRPQPIHVAVVELNDNGSYDDRRQIERAEACIDEARRKNLNGAVVAVFVHGQAGLPKRDGIWDGTKSRPEGCNALNLGGKCRS